MGDNEYQEALKLGKKEYKACVSQGRFPYLPVLDDILSRENIQTEQNMGLMQIPLDFVVGTATKGRTDFFGFYVIIITLFILNLHKRYNTKHAQNFIFFTKNR